MRAFVNTRDIEAGTDELDAPSALASWMRARDLAGRRAAGLDRSPAAAATAPRGSSASPAADLRRAVAVREALRGVLRAHAGREPPAAELVTGLREITAGLRTRLDVGDDGQLTVTPAGTGPDEGLARILLIAAEATTTGTWPRLKACSADDCQWAFYDRSPTRSGCWCSMAVCGSRAKSRAYRQRAARRGPATAAPAAAG